MLKQDHGMDLNSSYVYDTLKRAARFYLGLEPRLLRRLVHCQPPIVYNILHSSINILYSPQPHCWSLKSLPSNSYQLMHHAYPDDVQATPLGF